MNSPAKQPDWFSVLIGAVVFSRAVLLRAGEASPQPPPARIPTYTIQSTGILPGYEGSWARGINNAGQVVGYSYRNVVRDIVILEERAFLFDNNGMTDLGTSTAWSGGEAINAQGQITGWDIGALLDEEAFVWDDGALIFLGMFPGTVGASHGLDINDHGDVVGWCACGSAADRPFLWTADGGMIDLGAPPGTLYSRPQAINNHQQVVGTHVSFSNGQAFLWQEGEMTELPPPIGAAGASAWDINDLGQTIGSSGGTALLWQNGQVEYLALPPSNTSGEPRAINNHSQVVGSALWHRRQKYDLRPLLPPDTPWRLDTVADLNDAGQIVGRGLKTDVPAILGYVLTPIDCDADGDGAVDLADLHAFTSCAAGPETVPDGECLVADFDVDGDVDLVDYRSLELAFEPPGSP